MLCCVGRQKVWVRCPGRITMSLLDVFSGKSPTLAELSAGRRAVLCQPGGTFGPMCSAMAKELREFHTVFCTDPDIPEDMSEWGHKYFCPEDGGKLLWNLHDRKHHTCSVCGAIYSGSPYDMAWVTFYRNEAVQSLRKAAALWLVDGSAEWIKLIKEILGFYARNYSRFVTHARDKVTNDLTIDAGGCGRMMPQGLNEAIVVTRIVQTLEIVRSQLDKDFLAEIDRLLFGPILELLLPQINRIHNIPCWLNSAVGCIGVFRRDKSLIERALLHPELGLDMQLHTGTRNGLWYEGSMHYHFFTVEGILAFMSVLSRSMELVSGTLPKRLVANIEAMLVQSYEVAFSTGRFPSPNDGWPDVSVRTYAHVYHMGVAFFGRNSKVARLAAAVEASTGERIDIPLTPPYYFENRLSIEQFLYNPNFRVASIVARRGAYELKDSYVAMLRKGSLEIFFKYAHNGPSHAHPDKMNIEILYGDTNLSRDLSNSGYGSKLCNEWHRKTVSHNTVVVDGMDQVSTSGGELLKNSAGALTGKAIDVYPGVDYTRTIRPLVDGFEDEFQVSCSKDSRLDWFLHLESGILKLANGAVEGAEVSIGEGSGYGYLTHVKTLSDQGLATLFFERGSVRLQLELSCSGAVILRAKSPDNPGNLVRETLIMRVLAQQAVFKAKWTFFK